MLTRGRASALLCGAAALGTLRLPAAAQSGAPVRVASIPITGAAEPAIAREMGFFAKAGIEVDLQAMQGSAAIAAAVLSNAADIGFSAADTIATARSKGIRLVVIAPSSEYVSTLPSNDALLVVPANSPARQAKDLNGKTVAVNSLTGIANLTTRLWLDRNGGDSTTVKFVEIPFPAMPVAIQSGRVDAVQVAEPYIVASLKNGRMLANHINATMAKRWIITLWFTTPQWAAAHPDAVRAFAAAIRQTANWSNDERNAAARTNILAGYTKIDPGVISSMAPPHYGDVLTPALLQPVIDAVAKYSNFSSFPATDLIYTPPPA
jgi:NitT/TauT family transport system substrate-binding protein